MIIPAFHSLGRLRWIDPNQALRLSSAQLETFPSGNGSCPERAISVARASERRDGRAQRVAPYFPRPELRARRAGLCLAAARFSGPTTSWRKPDTGGLPASATQRYS